MLHVDPLGRQLELYTVLEVDRVAHNCVCTVRANLCHDALVYCTREYEATVIVGMLANKIDTSW